MTGSAGPTPPPWSPPPWPTPGGPVGPFSRVRSAFFAGLLVTVPIGVTIAVLWFLVSQVDQLQPRLLLGRPIPGLGILLVLTVVLGMGFATQHWVGRRVVTVWEGLIGRVPVFSSVYNGAKQVVEAAFAQGTRSVKGVVLVEWPRRGTWSIAFHTGDSFARTEDGRRMLSVFLPSTPNPTTGFYFLVAEDEVLRTGLTVEDAAKLLMSAGLVGAPSDVIVPRVLPVRDADEPPLDTGSLPPIDGGAPDGSDPTS